MIEFDIWWNSAAADSFRARHEDMDGEQFRPIWDAAVRAATQAPAPAPEVPAGMVLVPRAVLQRCRDTAMTWTMKARVPECGEFGGIAQDLDALLGDLPAPSPAVGAGDACLKVVKGDLCYKSKDDDQSFGMWVPVTPDADLGFANGTGFVVLKPPVQGSGS